MKKPTSILLILVLIMSVIIPGAGIGAEQYEISATNSHEEKERLIVAYYNTQVGSVDEFTNIDVLNYHPARVNGYNYTIEASTVGMIKSLRPRAEKQNPDIKILLTFMGNSGPDFEKWLINTSKCNELADRMLELVFNNGFDGLDIDYEFPTASNEQYKDNFIYVLNRLRTKMDERGAIDGKHYMLTIAVPASATWTFSMFKMKEIQNYVDYFNIMHYDMHINSPYTHHHTATALNPNGVPLGLTTNAESDIQYYLANGISKDKIVVGAGPVGYQWDNVQSDENGGLFALGTWNKSICHHYTTLIDGFVNKNGFVRYWDDVAKVPYLYNATTHTFISYDDAESIAAKSDLVNSYDVRGLMVFDYVTCDGVGFFDDLYTWLNPYHEWSDWATVRPATCIGTGKKTRECTVCGMEDSRTIPILDTHTPDEWTIITEPTETEEGRKIMYCAECGEEMREEVIPKLPADIKDKWYESYVKTIFTLGLMTGYPDGTFKGDENLSRAMFVTSLSRLDKTFDPENYKTQIFDDVAADAWFAPFVAWAYEKEIVKGTSDTTFGPNDNISREQMALIMYRYAESMELDVSGQADLAGYTDTNDISYWAETAVKWAVDAKLITGKSSTTLEPKSQATRAEVATILSVFVTLLGK